MSNQIILKKYAENFAKQILNSKKNKNFFKKPFEHIIIDNILNKNSAEKINKSFPKLTKQNWEFTNTKNIEIKYRSKWNSEFDIPRNIIDLVRILNSSIVLKAISKQIGIKKLIPDPYFSGGGLNITKKGGLLDIHVDGNYHDAMNLNRRLNLIIYFCKNWKKKYGGELGLYDANGKARIKSVEPYFNRLLIFNTHDKSFHGLPDKINFPKNSPRKSLILYYYTYAPRKNTEHIYKKPHSALWIKKRKKDKKGRLTRRFF